MTKKETGFAVLGGLLLLEAFLKGAISRQAAALGVSGGALFAGGVLAAAVVARLD